MKAIVSIATFGLLVFGVGWTSHVLAERISNPRSATSSWRSCSSNRCGDSHGPDAGPFLNTVECFATDLALSPEQRSRLAELVEQTSQELQSHENAQRQLIQKTRHQVDELLTATQRADLEKLIVARWEEYRSWKVDACLEWLLSEGVADPVRAQVEPVLESHEDRRGELFHDLHKSDAEWPSYAEIKAQLDRLQMDCDRELEHWLDEDVRRRFWEYSRTLHPVTGP